MLVLMSFPAIDGLRATLLVGLVFSSVRNPSGCGLVSSLLCCKCGSLPIFFFHNCSTSRFRLYYTIKSPRIARISPQSPRGIYQIHNAVVVLRAKEPQRNRLLQRVKQANPRPANSPASR